MTLCIAAMAEDRKAIVMAADRMVSTAFIESELEISKIIPIGDHWWIMLAADMLAGAFPIIDHVKAELAKAPEYDVEEVVRMVEGCYQEERRRRAEAQFLLPMGLTVESFLSQGRGSVTSRSTRVMKCRSQEGAMR